MTKVTDTRELSAALLAGQGTPKTGAVTPFCVQAACAGAERRGLATAAVRGAGETSTLATMVRESAGWMLASVARGRRA